MIQAYFCARCVPDGFGWAVPAEAGYGNHSTISHVLMGLHMMADPRLTDEGHRVMRYAAFTAPELSVSLLLLAVLRWLDQEPDAGEILRRAGL